MGGVLQAERQESLTATIELSSLQLLRFLQTSVPTLVASSRQPLFSLPLGGR